MLKIEEIAFTFSPREKIMFRALKIIGKMLRRNPMGDLDMYPADLMKVLVGGENRDPNGEEYVTYFINKAAKELREEGEI